MNDRFKWWQTGIVYQIYPRSFMDSNNDGIGDINGITAKLDYLQEIGVNILWLSPFYPSPMHDFGYDISDYCNVNEIFGSLEDFDNFTREAHIRGFKVIIDLVPNHTSSEHEWFKESRNSLNNEKRDWYIWRDPASDGGPPNNWRSYFGGSAWKFDKKTKQYYLHLFVEQQPDLNYRNPDVRKAMLDVMRFWLDRGVDGFRVDVIVCMIKDKLFRDNPVDPAWDGKNPAFELDMKYTSDRPEVHDIIKDMRGLLDEYGDKLMIGETYLPYNQLIQYYGKNNDECHLSFNFHLLEAKWKADVIKGLVDSYEEILPEGCWPSYVLGNHDQPRLASKIGAKQIRNAAILLLTLRGTPTVYYGEELGMHNVKIPKNKIQDPPALNMSEIADLVGRDPERTPMQWNSEVNAGFNNGSIEPWLPVGNDFKDINVAVQRDDEDSMLSFFKRLTYMRMNNPAFSIGDYLPLKLKTNNVFAYGRRLLEDEYIILLNFDDKVKKIEAKELERTALVLSTEHKREKVTGDIFVLGANEGVILKKLK